MRIAAMAGLSVMVASGVVSVALGGDGKTDAKEGRCCPTANAVAACETVKTETVAMKETSAKQTFEILKSLAGKYTGKSDEKQEKEQLQSEFKLTAGGSVVMETMFPGTNHEMVNCYHLDGENVILTHYCAQGVQPRMKLSSSDGKSMKFDFLDCTNLPSKDAPHMHDMTLTIDGDKITESWGYFKDGKVENHVTLEMTKGKAD